MWQLGSSALAPSGMWLALLLGAAGASSSSGARPAPRPPSVGAVESGAYRNMFIEAGYTQEAIDAKIEAAWQQLYFGARGLPACLPARLPAWVHRCMHACCSLRPSDL